MPMKNTPDAYGAAAKAFHWLTVVLIAAALVLAFVMEDMPRGPEKSQMYALHKSIGISVLIVTALRLIWRLISPPPAPVATLTLMEKKISAVMHAALYLLIITMPLSGWAMSSAAGFPVNVFGLFILPNLLAENKDLAEGLEEVHETIGTLIMIVAGLHAVAALIHHYIKKDAVLKRMLRG